MSNYWADRMAQSQAKLTSKNIKQVEAQMRKYYASTMKHTIASFEVTYAKLLAAVEADKVPTPADLYKLDTYWQMQGQLRKELRRLGERQVVALSKAFELNYFEIYHSIALDGLEAFNTIDEEAVQQMISQVWLADGKSWSARIWQNTERLADALNEELIKCVATGKKTSDLKGMLQERFAVSFSAADSLVRTEMAHIQTQAAQQRYKDYGIKEMEVWADADERRCDVCGKLHQKRVPIGEQSPVPAHPRCRCCLLPVVE